MRLDEEENQHWETTMTPVMTITIEKAINRETGETEHSTNVNTITGKWNLEEAYGLIEIGKDILRETWNDDEENEQNC